MNLGVGFWEDFHNSEAAVRLPYLCNSNHDYKTNYAEE